MRYGWLPDGGTLEERFKTQLKGSKPRPAPKDHTSNEYKQWKKDRKVWDKLDCPCGKGYLCKEHSRWVSGYEVTNEIAPPKDAQKKGACPAEYYSGPSKRSEGSRGQRNHAVTTEKRQGTTDQDLGFVQESGEEVGPTRTRHTEPAYEDWMHGQASEVDIKTAGTSAYSKPRHVDRYLDPQSEDASRKSKFKSTDKSRQTWEGEGEDEIDAATRGYGDSACGVERLKYVQDSGDEGALLSDQREDSGVK